jgi:hypothetical protein
MDVIVNLSTDMSDGSLILVYMSLKANAPSWEWIVSNATSTWISRKKEGTEPRKIGELCYVGGECYGYNEAVAEAARKPRPL